METNKMSNLNRIFTRNMLRHFIDGKTDNVYSSVVRRYTSNAGYVYINPRADIILQFREYSKSWSGSSAGYVRI